RGDHRRFLRPPRRGRLRQRRGPAHAHLRQDPQHRGRHGHRDVHVPPAAQADLLLGCPLTTSGLSFWHDSVGGAPQRPPLPSPILSGPTEADVVVVGAGYTGLWTAHYL